MKYGVKKVQGDQALTKQCYMATLQGVRPPEALPIEGLDTYDELAKECIEPIEHLIPIPLEDGNMEHTV